MAEKMDEKTDILKKKDRSPNKTVSVLWCDDFNCGGTSGERDMLLDVPQDLATATRGKLQLAAASLGPHGVLTLRIDFVAILSSCEMHYIQL